MVCGIGGLMLAATYVTPKFLLGGLVVGELVALIMIGGATRRFLDPAVHRRWVEQFENGRTKVSPPITWLVGCFISKVIRPRKTVP
jgi:hypothetical protein